LLEKSQQTTDCTLAEQG